MVPLKYKFFLLLWTALFLPLYTSAERTFTEEDFSSGSSLTDDSLYTSPESSLNTALSGNSSTTSNAEQNSLWKKFFSKQYKQGRFHFLHTQLFFILNNKGSFREHNLLATPKYAFYLSSFLPTALQTILGRWAVQLGLSWVYTLKSFKPQSMYPFLGFLGGHWELAYFPYITPYLDWAFVYRNPFKKSQMPNYFNLANTDSKNFYLFSIGCLVSFNLLDRNFSLRMDSEYNIENMGLFVEYQRYSSSWKNSFKKGYSFGFFLRM